MTALVSSFGCHLVTPWPENYQVLLLLMDGDVLGIKDPSGSLIREFLHIDCCWYHLSQLDRIVWYPQWVICIVHRSNPSCSMLFPGRIHLIHLSFTIMMIFMKTSSNSAQCQLSFALASLIPAKVNQSSFNKIHNLEVFTLGHLFRVDSVWNPSSPSTSAGIFPTSPGEIEVCSKHLNLAENVLMHSH